MRLEASGSLIGEVIAAKKVLCACINNSQGYVLRMPHGDKGHLALHEACQRGAPRDLIELFTAKLNVRILSTVVATCR
jgi:hypothetical protein